MEDWIRTLKHVTKRSPNPNELLNGYHDWFVCSHARPTFCNICREALNGVTSHGLSCEICKFKAHKRCVSKASRNCKWTTLASIGSNEIIEDEDRNICMPHQWIEGNLPVNAKCSYCEKACGSVLRMQDFRCLWCKAYVHSHCKDNFLKKCNLGVCRVSILPPTHINTVTSDGFVRASKAPNTSPLVVFVNSKSGDNQGVKFLRKFKQLLNPFQVFDLIQDGPVLGLRMFQKFDCFRVLVCGGDGSVGWVLKEIDTLNLHKQCQIGVLPLGTGNDLARVLGWGSALDDDSQLPKLLESFERATTKMLDRWSMMTYELPMTLNDSKANLITSKKASNTDKETNLTSKLTDQMQMLTISSNFSSSTSINVITNDNLVIPIKKYIWFHLNNILQSDNIEVMIESSQILNSKLNELLMRVNDCNKYLLNESNNGEKNINSSQYMLNVNTSIITEKCVAVRHKLDSFFSLLKSHLKTNEPDESKVNSTSLINLSNSNIYMPSLTKTGIPNDLMYSPSSTCSWSSRTTPITSSSSEASSHKSLSTTKLNKHSVSSSTNLSMIRPDKHHSSHNTNENNSSSNRIKRRIMLNLISKIFKHRRKILSRANSLKKSIKQIIRSADLEHIDTQVESTYQTHYSFPMIEKKNQNLISINVNGCFSDDKTIHQEEIIKYKNVTYDNYEDDYVDREESSYGHEYLLKNTSTTYDLFNSSNQAAIFTNTKSKICRPNIINLSDQVAYKSKSNYFLSNKSDKISDSAILMNAELTENLIPNLLIKADQSQVKASSIKESVQNMNSSENDSTSSSSRMNDKGDYVFESSELNELESFLTNSSSVLTINRTLYSNGVGMNDVPLASEEQSCMSTPNNTNLSLSIDSIYKQHQQQLAKFQRQSSLSRPIQLDLYDKSTSSVTAKQNETDSSVPKQETNNCCSSYFPAPRIRITSICDDDGSNEKIKINYESGCMRLENSRSPSFLGYVTSTPSLSITPNSAYDINGIVNKSSPNFFLDSPGSKNNSSFYKSIKSKPKLAYLLPPSVSSLAIKNSSSNINSSPNLNSSSSSNNLSTRLNEFNNLGVPPSPSGYSSTGSCYSKTNLPSPRISKKYSKEILTSSMHLQLPAKRGISALSASFRRRSMSKSSDKSSSPTSPPSPKFVFKYNNQVSSHFGFVGQALLFNADALCAPIAAPMVNEPILNLFSEKAVMNNYFGIGLDAKIALEFHMTREEHPEKCRSRIRNHMLYGILSGKELVQRTCKNLEQKVLLECDGTVIPLKNVQGIVVLNIPSYTAGVNFWGKSSKDENVFTIPSYDDKILEVVAISGCMQMALSRVVNIKSNRIAQCHSVKIQIIGPEGVPVQVDGEAWIQRPGFIYLVHKNRAQMLTRNKVFEHTLKTWSEKQKNDPHLNVSLSKEEFNTLQCILDDSITLIKRIKTASLRNIQIEQDVCGYAIQASSNLEEISVNGKILEKSLRQQVTDFLNSIRTLHVETGLFINENANKLNIEHETIEKIQAGLNDLKISMKKLNDCRGIFQFPMENYNVSDDLEYKRKSRFGLVQRYKKSKIKHKDDKELLRALHGIPIEEWGPDEVSLWLESLNLAEYKSAFIRHDIRGTEIRNLERRDLRELGIVKVGHIKRILNASKEIPKKVAIEKQSV